MPHDTQRTSPKLRARPLVGLVACLALFGAAVPAHASEATPRSTTHHFRAWCANADLAIRLGRFDGAMGHWGQVVVFRNISGHPCRMRGYPYVGGVELDGIEAPATPTLNGYLGGAHALQTVRLDPLEEASVLVEGADVPTGPDPWCPAYRALRVGAPQDWDRVVIAVDLQGCGGLETHPVVPGDQGSDA